MNPGTQLGPYRVESLIGAGGMGEVYLGVDTRLDRQVAIKVLAGARAKDATLRERFEREARTISSLSHPNICTLFDLGRHGESDYLVMEYLQGETLADRISRGALPAEQVLRIGSGIANALEAAHRQGIVHRDLKPGNVMLTKSGVKLLDFGLAKLSAVASDSVASTAAFGATEQKPLTEQGTILGTFQYMAPEQLEGEPADARSDIFALGAILYEMATGRRAFEASSKASLIAAILERDPPPMTELQPLTPPALERVVRACLAKDPGERIQTAHDVALQLKWIGESSTMTEPASVRRTKKLGPWIVAAAFALASVAAGAMWWRERVKPSPPFTLSIAPTPGHDMWPPVLAPHGRSLAFIQSRRDSRERSLWIRHLEDGSEKQLAKGEIFALFWSPDGKWIGYREAPDRIMRVSSEGGSPETITRSTVQTTPAWGETGVILFSRAFGEGLYRVPATGGEPVAFSKLDAARNESIQAQPHFLPGGRRYLYVSHTIAEKRNEIWAGSLDGEKPVHVGAADALIGYSSPYLVFVRDGAAYAQRFDPESLRLSDEPRRVLDDVAFAESEVAAFASMARDGSLAYSPFVSTLCQLAAYERNGSLSGVLWENPDIIDVDLASDGSTLVVSKTDRTKGADDIHAVDLARKVATRITTGLATHGSPRISPDGQSVVFQSDRGGMFDIYAQPVDGSSPARVLWKDRTDKFVYDWAPDGRNVLVSRYTPETKSDIWVVPADGQGAPWPFLATEGREAEASFSPDGKWVSYLVMADGEPELYIRPFPKGRAVRVSTDGAGNASWTPDGREIIWSSRGRIVAATIDTSGERVSVGTPKELFRLPRIWSRPIALKDGRIAVLVPAPGEETTRTYVFTNAWRAKLERSGK